jgi:hypothetical protein
MDDTLPAGAGTGSSGGDGWNWVTTNPAPFSGAKAHQSNLASGLHDHLFNWAGATLPVNTGDTLFCYVYLGPSNPPTEIMLSWNADNWEHRAYWGANSINYGTDGTTGRHYMGPLPQTGQWVRLEVPASAVGMEGQTAIGMGFSLYDGRATWDYTGKTSASAQTPVLPTVAVSASDASATIGTTDTGAFTFTRTGDTTSNLVVNYTLAGSAVAGTDYLQLGNSVMPTSVTIPTGSASTTLTIQALANSTGASSETAALTLASSGGYTIGSPSSASVSILPAANGSGSNGGVTNSGTGGGTNFVAGGSTNSVPGTTAIDCLNTQLPRIGDSSLHVLSPTLLELHLINSTGSDGATVTNWNFVNSGSFSAPATSEFSVTVNGNAASVQSVGFKRRPLYAPLNVHDLRIDNCLYLQLSSPISDNQTVQVTNPDGSLWKTNNQFVATTDPLRFSPAIHVNEEGYMPTFPKKAIVGYYLGSMGEMTMPSTSFSIVDATTGAQVYSGTLTARADAGPSIGYTYTPSPYQHCWQADFSSFTTPGKYRLMVPGLGASLPFLITDGVAMEFARAYALGIYHQRCGTSNSLPYTRFTHDACHTAPAQVPTPASSFPFTWTTVAGYGATINSDNPPQTAPLLTNEASQLFPFVNKGSIDVSGGHHDAGDYSKYTINSALLVHQLMFAVDSLPGVAALDNLGIPESGDGISDVMQECKWEADFLAKMQDADGGFYFLVYPKTREYESNVMPDQGDSQVVWPKTTSVTAASVAALAQCASSPKFKAAYPAAAALYMQKARLGWTFLTNAIAKYGKSGCYQRITHYGDDFTDKDELAWAACEMFLATGDQSIHQTLKSWFPDPTDPTTFRWGWWRLFACYGCAVRSYAFAATSGRLPASQLDSAYLAKCQQTIVAAGDDCVTWCQDNAYGTSFPDATKRVLGAGWYFSSDQAYDISVAYQINPKTNYLDVLLQNLNYEAGCNPVNASYVTGLGQKRQREIVNQYAENDRRVLPPDGIPLGNIQLTFGYVYQYGGVLASLCYPSDGASTAPYPFYDRWGDAFNTSTEFITVNQARSLASLAFLATLTSTKTQTWSAASATTQISVPTGIVPVNVPVTVSLSSSMDLSGAKIVWEARDQEPYVGSTFTFSPKNNGPQWVEAEAQWPDGRRLFSTASFDANSPNVVWVEDNVPNGGQMFSDGGDTWNWVSSNPTPFSGSLAHQSAVAAGVHEHYFDWANATLEVDTNDTLYCYVYLDPANVPSEIMLHWNDGSSEHRAYWGANLITYGSDGTPGRRYMGALPAAGQWVKLQVPASQVGLEGSTLKGMTYSCYGGRATWDCAGKTSGASSSPSSSTLRVVAASPNASLVGPVNGSFKIIRSDTNNAVTVNYTLTGTATNGVDYNAVGNSVTIPAGSMSSAVMIVPKATTDMLATKSVVLTLSTNSSYSVTSANSALVSICNSFKVSWAGQPGATYHIAYKNRLTDPTWTDLSGAITATNSAMSWSDPTAAGQPSRFYNIYRSN